MFACEDADQHYFHTMGSLTDAPTELALVTISDVVDAPVTPEPREQNDPWTLQDPWSNQQGISTAIPNTVESLTPVSPEGWSFGYETTQTTQDNAVDDDAEVGDTISVQTETEEDAGESNVAQPTTEETVSFDVSSFVNSNVSQTTTENTGQFAFETDEKVVQKSIFGVVLKPVAPLEKQYRPIADNNVGQGRADDEHIQQSVATTVAPRISTYSQLFSPIPFDTYNYADLENFAAPEAEDQETDFRTPTLITYETNSLKASITQKASNPQLFDMFGDVDEEQQDEEDALTPATGELIVQYWKLHTGVLQSIEGDNCLIRGHGGTVYVVAFEERCSGRSR